MVALLVRALAWRKGAALAVLTVAVIASAAAALGPMYARSAEESLLAERLEQAPGFQIGLTVQTAAPSASIAVAGQPVGPDALVAAARGTAGDPRLARWFGALSTWASSLEPLDVYDPGGAPFADAPVTWRERACEGLRISSGTCRVSSGQVLMSRRSAQAFHLALGSTVRLPIGPGGSKQALQIVGLYEAQLERDAIWGGQTPSTFALPLRDELTRLDELLVSQQDLLGTLGSSVRVHTVRPLVRSGIDLATVDAATAAIAAVVAQSAADHPPGDPGPVVTVSSGLVDAVQAIAADRANLHSATLAITAQLVAVAWFVLFVVVAGTTDERGGEIALAKLRGLSPIRTATHALAEVTVLLTVALPLGLAVAYLVDRLVVAAVLRPGTLVRVDLSTLAALVLAFVGGLAAAGLATRAMLTMPVVDQLRRTSGSRRSLARSVAIDAVAVTVAAEGVHLLRSGASDTLALLTPAAVALAAGLVAVRLLPLVARLEVRSTRGRSDVARFLSARNLARRPSGGRLAVLLSVAVALAVFGVQGWRTAQAVRSDQARAEVGAMTVLHVVTDAPGPLLQTVQRVDPDGRWAMAALVQGDTLAVDAPRLVAVSSWDARWAGTSPAALAAALRPPGPTPVLVNRRLMLAADFRRTDPGSAAGPDAGSGAGSTAGSTAPARVDLAGAVRLPDGTPRLFTLGSLVGGRHTYTAALPDCVPTCTLVRLGVTPDPFAARPAQGVFVVEGLSDARGPVDAGWGTPGRWQPALSESQLINPGTIDLKAVSVVTAGSGSSAGSAAGLGLAVHGTDHVEVADHPQHVPALLGNANRLTSYADLPGLWRGTGLDGDQVILQAVTGSGLLPRVGRVGVMVDYGNAVDAALGQSWHDLDGQVWLSATAPSTARAQLEAAGLTVTRAESLPQRRAALDGDGTSLALVLYLVAATAAILLAAGALIATTYVAARRRAFELAAARLLGARRRSLVRAGRREQLALALVGVLVGAIAGWAATALVIGVLPSISGGPGAAEHHGIDWPVLIAMVAAVVVVLAVMADVGARRVVALADPALLRQNQA